MATWKKVLVAGADLTDTNEFTNNTADLVSSTATTGIAVTNGSNVMLGNNTQVSVAVDINGLGTTLTDTTVSNSDFLMVADVDDSNKIKKITLSDAVGAASTGVSSLQLKGTSGTTGAADTGAVVFQINGGTGISTVASDDADDGKIVINANVATTGAQGIAQFSSDNFAVNTGTVTIKDGGVATAEIVDSAVTTAKINDQAVTDAKIANAGITSAGKVSLTAVRFHDFGPHITNENQLDGADRIILNDASDVHGSGDHNYTSTLGTLDAFIQDNSASFGTVHTSLSVGPAGAGFNLTGGNLVYVQNVTTDSHGHVTAVSTGTIPDAASNVSGIVTDGIQTFGGAKTFAANASFSGDVTVTGALTVNGNTTTLNTATLEVNDKDIVGAVPSAAHSTTNSSGYAAAQAAAEGGGFFLASHHGTDVAAFAGLSWSASGQLTGWSLNDTAVPEGGSGTDYDASGDANSAKYSVAVMSFGSTASTTPSGPQMGVGGFHFNTTDKKLYVRID